MTGGGNPDAPDSQPFRVYFQAIVQSHSANITRTELHLDLTKHRQVRSPDTQCF